MTSRVLAPARAWGARLLVATLLVTGAGAFTVAPAQAAACQKGSGVTVVVNGDVRCDSNGGGPAAANFRDVGHSLRPVSTQPGFVCQVNGAPAGDPCINTPPSYAYWALWWSDGTSGTWNYSDSGVSGLTVPAGGWVAFVFQTSSGRTPPSVRPVGAAPAPAPAQPSGGAGSGSSSGSGSTSGGGSAAAPSTDPGATPGAAPGATPGTEPSADPSADPSSAATSADERDDKTRATSSSVDDPGSGSPWGIVVAVLLVGGVVAAAFVVNRRRQSDV